MDCWPRPYGSFPAASGAKGFSFMPFNRRKRYLLGVSATCLGVFCMVVMLSRAITAQTEDIPPSPSIHATHHVHEAHYPAANLTTVNTTAETAARALNHARNTLLNAFETVNQAIAWSKYAVTTASVASHSIAVQAEEDAKQALAQASTMMNTTMKLGTSDIVSVQGATKTYPSTTEEPTMFELKLQKALKQHQENMRQSVQHDVDAIKKAKKKSSHDQSVKKGEEEDDEEEHEHEHASHHAKKEQKEHDKHAHDKHEHEHEHEHRSDKDEGKEGKKSALKKSSKTSSSTSSASYPAATVNSPLISLLEDMSQGMSDHVAKMRDTLNNAQAVVNTALVEAKQTFENADRTDESVENLDQAVKSAQQAAANVVHQAQAAGNSASQHIAQSSQFDYGVYRGKYAAEAHKEH